MKRVLGLVLIGRIRSKRTIPSYEISLIGRPVVAHAVAALSAVCERVIVEHASHSREAESQILKRVLRRVQQEQAGERLKEEGVIIHDAFQPVLRVQLVEQVRQAMALGVVAVATSPLLHGEVFPRDRTHRDLKVIEPPAGFHLRELGEYLSQNERTRESISSLAVSVAEKNRASLALVSRTYVSGKMFTNMTADEAEALLRVAPKYESASGQDSQLNVRRVLVLGGTGGIGQACIKLLGEKRISYLAPPREELDLRQERDFRQLAQVDAVIHSAGSYSTSAKEIMEVNFHSCIRLLEAAEASEWTGRIVFLSSTAATYGRRGAPVYSASKAALNSLIEAECGRLARKGILLDAVAPARVATVLQERLNPGTPATEMINPRYVAKVILRVLSSPSSGRIVYIRRGEDF